MLIVDTGPIVATANVADRHHEACLLTTPLVVAEAGWLIRRELGPAAEAVLYQSISDSEVQVETLTAEDWARVGMLVVEYADLGLDAADASIVAIAERHAATVVATLDHRDFRVVRPVHCAAFDLLPVIAP